MVARPVASSVIAARTAVSARTAVAVVVTSRVASPAYAPAARSIPHAERAAFGVDGHVEDGGGEEADAVEILAGRAGEVIVELLKLGVIQSPVGVGLGDVLREDGEFAQAVERLGDLFEIAVLGLGEGDGIAHV